jgi:heme A synthase
MDSPWLHRFAVLVGVCSLILIAIGACVTDYDGGPPLPAVLAQGHRAAAVAVGVLTLCLAIWLSTGAQPGFLLRSGWIAFALFLVEGALGIKTPLLHAFIAQLFFAVTVAIAVCTSSGWKRGADPVQDQGWPSLRSLSVAAMCLVLLQVWLGAAFRHQAAGLMPHMAGAIVVAIVNLIICMFVMQQFPEHGSLRPTANILLTVTLVQVVLGITALTTRMMAPDNTLPTPLLVATVIHVATGALTLAATVVLTIQIRLHVRKKDAC